MTYHLVYRERTFRFGTGEKPKWSVYDLSSHDSLSRANQVADEIAESMGIGHHPIHDRFVCKPLFSIPHEKDDRYGAWWKEQAIRVTTLA